MLTNPQGYSLPGVPLIEDDEDVNPRDNGAAPLDYVSAAQRGPKSPTMKWERQNQDYRNNEFHGTKLAPTELEDYIRNPNEPYYNPNNVGVPAENYSPTPTGTGTWDHAAMNEEFLKAPTTGAEMLSLTDIGDRNPYAVTLTPADNPFVGGYGGGDTTTTAGDLFAANDPYALTNTPPYRGPGTGKADPTFRDKVVPGLLKEA